MKLAAHHDPLRRETVFSNADVPGHEENVYIRDEDIYSSVLHMNRQWHELAKLVRERDASEQSRHD